MKLANVNGQDQIIAQDTATGETTIDEADRPYLLLPIQPPNPHPGFDQSATAPIMPLSTIVARERIILPGHDLHAVFEVNAKRIDQDSPIPEFLPHRFLLRLTVNGANFSRQLNGEDVIRPGHFDEGRFTADVIGNTGLPGSFVAELDVHNESANPQTDFGLIIPVRTDGGDDDARSPCDPVTLTVEIYSAIPNHTPRLLGRPDTLTLLTCDDAYNSIISSSSATADVRSSYKTLIDDDYQIVNAANIGSIKLRSHPFIFDAKAPNNSETRRISFNDIDQHTLSLQFNDLTGIENVSLTLNQSTTTIHGALDRMNDRVTFHLTGMDHQENAIDDSADNLPLEAILSTGTISIHLFDEQTPKTIKIKNTDTKGNDIVTTVRTGAGPVREQDIFIIENRLRLKDPCKDDELDIFHGLTLANHQSVKRLCDIPLETGLLGRIKRNGESFGPFDWVSQPNGEKREYFRLTGIPETDAHGTPISVLEGTVEVKNATGTPLYPGEMFNGIYHFSFPIDRIQPSTGANGVFLIGPNFIHKTLRRSLPSSAFGSADLTFTFHLDSDPSNDLDASNTIFGKLDLDRLMVTGEKMSSFFDNANDVSSVHTISGDTGRFGPRSALKKE